jgi:hypothetical protein
MIQGDVDQFVLPQELLGFTIHFQHLISTTEDIKSLKHY